MSFQASIPGAEPKAKQRSQAHRSLCVTIAEFLARFDDSRPTGGQWFVKCPGHDDRRASLAVREGADGRVLLHCHARCSTDRILTSMGLTSADLFTGVSPTTASSATIAQTYDYSDERRVLLYQSVRLEPKAFFQRRPNGAGGWITSVKGVRHVVYHLPDLKGREHILIVEGEKDVDACWAVGLPATCNAGGAGKWRDDYAQQLLASGARTVYVVPDNDAPGRAHAEHVARSCAAAGLDVRIVLLPDLPPKGDVTDFLVHHSKDELLALARTAPAFVGRHDLVSSRGTGHDAILIRMSDVQPEPVSWVWSRRLARGKVTALMGDPGVGKSFLALDMAARITTGGRWPDGGVTTAGDVVLLTAEDGLADTVRPRLDACGADTSRVWVLDAIRIGDGETRAFALETDIERLRAVILSRRAVLVIIDPVSSYLGSVESYKDTDVRRVLGPLVRLASETGVAMLGLLHLNKDTKAHALQRGMASMAFVAMPRIVLVVGPDPTEPNALAPGSRRVLASLKQNICEPAVPWSYVIEGGRVVWSEAREDLNAEMVLGGVPFTDAEARHDVEAFLREFLADGPHLQTEVVREAADRSISQSRLFRTRKKVCECEKVGFGTGRWYWRLKGDQRSLATGGSATVSPDPAKNGDSHPVSREISTTSSFFAGTAKNGEGANNGGDVTNPEYASVDQHSSMGETRVERIRTRF
jgi:putative DNA primase/helicase